VLYSAACKHLAAVQKIVDVLIERDARDELTRTYLKIADCCRSDNNVE
jgi:hypothetical protein